MKPPSIVLQADDPHILKLLDSCIGVMSNEGVASQVVRLTSFRSSVVDYLTESKQVTLKRKVPYLNILQDNIVECISDNGFAVTTLPARSKTIAWMQICPYTDLKFTEDMLVTLHTKVNECIGNQLKPNDFYKYNKVKDIVERLMCTTASS